jgi:hypothetical protein
MPHPNLKMKRGRPRLQLEEEVYDALLPSEMRRLKQLEDENSKLRKVVADLSLDKEMPQDALRRNIHTYGKCGPRGRQGILIRVDRITCSGST